MLAPVKKDGAFFTDKIKACDYDAK